MSYCLSIQTDEGLVLCTASWGNNSKNTQMHRFVWSGNRFICILSSGNQITIDAVLNQLRKDLNQHTATNLLNTNSLDETADYIAVISKQTQTQLMQQDAQTANYEACFIVAGQIRNQHMGTLLIYTQGHYINEPIASSFLQIGETKYGKPILDRLAKRNATLATAARCALVSVDSTLRSNTQASFQTELLVYKNNSLETCTYLTFDKHHAFFKAISETWDSGINNALNHLPKFDWEVQINE